MCENKISFPDTFFTPLGRFKRTLVGSLTVFDLEVLISITLNPLLRPPSQISPPSPSPNPYSSQKK